MRLPLLFSVISFSLPPHLSLPHSSEGCGSSKDTLVDSRKSGCCRSDKNLVGVSKWVEPVEEQRRLHHSSHSTCFAPAPPLFQKNKRVKNTQKIHTRPDSLHIIYTLVLLHKHRHDLRQTVERQQLKQSTTKLTRHYIQNID